MLNVLFVINDELKIGRFKHIFTDDTSYKYSFFCDAISAVEFIKENPVDIALVSVGMEIVNGAEMAEMIFDISPKCMFTFSYKQDEINDAIALFNIYDYSRIIDHERTEPENVKDILKECSDFLSEEEVHKLKNENFRHKEMAYKKTMFEMSSMLNARIACYSSVIDMYCNSGALLFDRQQDEAMISVLDFFKKQLSFYVQLYLDRRVDFNEIYSDLIASNNHVEEKKFFQFNSSIEMSDDEVFYNMTYLIRMICSSFNTYMKGYRGRVDISEDDLCYRVDIIYDLRIGQPDIKSWGYVCCILEDLIKAFCNRQECASRNGIMQYRLFFTKDSLSEETCCE